LGDWSFLVLRFLPDGSLDPTFATDGVWLYEYNGYDEQLYDMALQQDGKILVAGEAGPGDKAVLGRLLPNGSLDTDFGDAGFVVTDISTNDERIQSIEALEDGKIIVGAEAVNTSNNLFEDFVLVKYLPDGSLDNSFGNGGIVKTDVGLNSANLRDTYIYDDGKILAAGNAANGSGPGNDLAVVRYLPNGDLDNSFGDGGIALTDFSGADEWIFAMTVQPDAKIVGVGRIKETTGIEKSLAVRFFGTNDPDLYFESDTQEATFCAGNPLTVHLTLASIAGFSEQVTLSVDGLPAEAEAVFYPSDQVHPDENVMVEINVTGVPSGEYSLLLEATAGNVYQSEALTIVVEEAVSISPVLMEPSDESKLEYGPVLFEWAHSTTDVFESTLEVASNPSFGANIVIKEILMEEGLMANDLPAGIYYWRVQTTNDCGGSNYSPVWAFQILENTCIAFEKEVVDGFFSATNPVDTVISAISISSMDNILDVNLSFSLDYDYYNNLTAFLQSPQGTEILLFDEPGVPGTSDGCSGDGMDITFDDEAFDTSDDLETYCLQNDPDILEGTFQPVGFLSDFQGASVAGDWKLVILEDDDSGFDQGTLDYWSLEICDEVEAPQLDIINNVPSSVANAGTVSIPSSALLSTSPTSSASEISYILRSLPENGSLLVGGSPLQLGDQFTQSQIDALLVFYVHNGSPTLEDAFTFDVLSEENAWIPNQTYSISIQPFISALNDFSTDADYFQVYPNPSRDQVYLKWENAVLGKLELSLFNWQGKEIATKNFHNTDPVFETSLDLNHLPGGAYYFRLRSDVKTVTQSIVVLR
jgi:uncharacterized delta-60 repeat protein